MILAVIHHPVIEYEYTLQFVVDTGAEKTLVVPAYEELLCIPDSELIESPYEMDSIGGPVFFRCLPKCSLIFTDRLNRPYPVHGINIHFFSRKKMKKLPLTGVPDYPNLLGRDVLEQMSLGYCQTSECLFITKETVRYREALIEDFPQPFHEMTWCD